MSYQFTVSPDFSPNHIAGWYIFNTWLQKQTDNAVHLEMYNDFHEQKQAIQNDKVDLIYANPFDAAVLVREKGFQPLVKVRGAADEVIIAVNAENPIKDAADLVAGIKVAATEAPDVQMMGMIMLEPGDLDASNVVMLPADTYVIVAKQLLKNEADVGIFLAEAYEGLSSMIQKMLHVLVRSQISVIHHSLLLGPKLMDQREDILQVLLNMHKDDKGRGVLESLGFEQWQPIDNEEMEFMIDLMDTLTM